MRVDAMMIYAAEEPWRAKARISEDVTSSCLRPYRGYWLHFGPENEDGFDSQLFMMLPEDEIERARFLHSLEQAITALRKGDPSE
ncbi:hypothetical protein [Streptomyces zaomyceticus]|uniref:hypothetical protein n=1 Tax=Streptomyces zaomyceticus TaxID=68286 RepID=UPI0036B8B6C1